MFRGSALFSAKQGRLVSLIFTPFGHETYPYGLFAYPFISFSRFFIKFILFGRQQRSLMLLFQGLLHLLLNRARKWKLF